ncbi:hypothetical protein GGI04_001730 [Coemansia thaxteri]|nr:hypothetical protein GGI04_001730 [Coemansia thaxteri]KAJ2325029.1 hypothetical protein GGH92_010543 [Coemansia sp. RSA 2673]
MSMFSMPTDSEFILAQGRMAQETRRRRMSDASVPSSMSTIPHSSSSHLLLGQSTGRPQERRRNTLGSTMFQTPPVCSNDAFHHEQLRPSTAPLPALPAAANTAQHQHTNLANVRNSPPAAKSKDSPHVLFLMPLTPPQSPAATKSTEPLPFNSTYAQPRHANAILQPPLATIPERCISAYDSASMVGSLPCPTPAFDQLTATDSCEDIANTRHIVLGSKKICLARPRLIQIPLPTSQPIKNNMR